MNNNPWGATTRRDLLLRQVGCLLLLAYIVVSIVGLVLFIGRTEYGWFT